MAFLVASWTLNVALIVAYFFNTTYPAGVVWMDEAADSAFRTPPHRPPPGFHFDPAFRSHAQNMFRSRREIMMELSDVLSADDLDTVRVKALGDSIKTVRATLFDGLIDQMIVSHGNMTPDERRRLVHRFLKEIDGKPRSGRPHHERREIR